MKEKVKKFKQEVYSVLDVSDTHSLFSRVLNTFLIVIICLNVLAVCLETVEDLYKQYEPLFYDFELFSVVIFSAEYILRVWAITSNEKYSHPVWGRLRFIFSRGALIDLVAIMPFYLPLVFVGIDLRAIRVLRLFRLTRVLKITRYINATKMITNVFRSKRGELGAILLLIVFLMVVISCVMYNVEHSVQPGKFSSIPETMLWSISTLTSTGFEGIYPITTLGKTLTSIISLLGIGIVALPAGILASGFAEEMKRNKTGVCNCPNCGCNKENKVA